MFLNMVLYSCWVVLSSYVFDRELGLLLLECSFTVDGVLVRWFFKYVVMQLLGCSEYNGCSGVCQHVALWLLVRCYLVAKVLRVC